MYMTFFRNQGTGLRTPFTDPQSMKPSMTITGMGYAVGQQASCSSTAPGPLRAAGPSAYNYWFAFVGNVLGMLGETTAANGWSYQGDWSGKPYIHAGMERRSRRRRSVSGRSERSYIFRHGNYDYVNGSDRRLGLRRPADLPDSFYLGRHPPFLAHQGRGARIHGRG